MRCPACGTTNPASQKFCGTCGAAIPTSDSETVISPAPAQTPLDHGHFVPGQMVGDRYRMVALLGRGGMGEVYRAEDPRDRDATRPVRVSRRDCVFLLGAFPHHDQLLIVVLHRVDGDDGAVRGDCGVRVLGVAGGQKVVKESILG